MQNVTEQTALDLHQTSIIIDALEYAPRVTDIGYLDEQLAAGETAAHISVVPTNGTALQAMKSIKHWYDIFELRRDILVPVLTAEDIEKAKNERKLGIILGSQQAEIIGDDVDMLTVYKRMGLRIIQLSYYVQSPFGEGFNERTDGGLTKLGVEVVAEMNRLGLLIDVSHCKDQVTMDAANFSRLPVVATHANPRALAKHPRNKTDEQIRAIASKGGVIGMVSYRRLCETKSGIRPELSDFLDCVDYTVGLVGPDHVGIGLDTDPFWDEKAYDEFQTTYPDFKTYAHDWGWKDRNVFTKDGREDISGLIQITKGLLSRGYREEDVRKILGLNFLRVFREVCG
jgi:membrane dipeptidase